MNDAGIGISSSSNNNFSSITTSLNYAGLNLYSNSNNNTVNSLTAQGNTLFQIGFLSQSNNNLIRNSTLSLGLPSSPDVSVDNSTDNIFLNTVYTLSKERVRNKGLLTRQWYYQTRTKD